MYRKYHGKRRFGLGRSSSQYKHLLKVMLNHLINHQRIQTTVTKAKALRAFADKTVITLKKANYIDHIGMKNNKYKSKLQGTIKSRPAYLTMMSELSARYADRQSNFTRIVKTSKRKGDNTQMAYIEFVGNDIEKYQQALKKEQEQLGHQEYQQTLFKEERDMFIEKLVESENHLKQLQIRLEEGEDVLSDIQTQQGVVRFFSEKLRRVEHDITIMNKNPYDLMKLPNYF